MSLLCVYFLEEWWKFYASFSCTHLCKHEWPLCAGYSTYSPRLQPVFSPTLMSCFLSCSRLCPTPQTRFVLFRFIFCKNYVIISTYSTDLQVVLLDLEILAEISSSPAAMSSAPSVTSSSDISLCNPALNGYFVQFLISLLQLFSTDRQLLEDRGSFIIRFPRVSRMALFLLLLNLTLQQKQQ